MDKVIYNKNHEEKISDFAEKTAKDIIIDQAVDFAKDKLIEMVTDAFIPIFAVLDIIKTFEKAEKCEFYDDELSNLMDD